MPPHRCKGTKLLDVDFEADAEGGCQEGAEAEAAVAYGEGRPGLGACVIEIAVGGEYLALDGVGKGREPSEVVVAVALDAFDAQ